MYRTLIPTLVKAQRDGQIEKGRKGKLDEGEHVDLELRIRSPELLPDARWDRYQRGFVSIRAVGQGVYSGNNSYPENHLYFVIVKPLQKLRSTQPPNSSTPWHISVSFYDKARRADFEELERQFSVPKKVTLKDRLHGIGF